MTLADANDVEIALVTLWCQRSRLDHRTGCVAGSCNAMGVTGYRVRMVRFVFGQYCSAACLRSWPSWLCVTSDPRGRRGRESPAHFLRLWSLQPRLRWRSIRWTRTRTNTAKGVASPQLSCKLLRRNGKILAKCKSF